MHIAIIGNGISGITAARWLRKLSDHRITVISSESEFFFSRTALMYIYMGHMRFEDTKPYEDWFWAKNQIDLIQGHVNKIDFESKKIELDNSPSLSYDKLILALGSKPNKFGWPGQDLEGVSGLYSLGDLVTMEEHSKSLKRAVVVGGGLIGVEMAEMFASRKIPVTFLVREKSFWDMVLPHEESQMISSHILEHHIDLRLETNLGEIIDDGTGKVEAVITQETGDRIDCGFVGLTPGVHPNVHFLKNTTLEIDRGILVDDYLQTNIADVYAIGDCAQLKSPKEGRRNIEAIWYVGRMMGETVAHTICDQPKSYDPGIWFNSAKFFDIEYQVYGQVLAHPPANHKSLFWLHKDGQKSIRLVYDSDSYKILGFNLMGIRFRHEVCERWIKNETHIEEVLRRLDLANFDPEFYPDYSQELLHLYRRETGIELKSETKSTLNDILHFIKS